MNPVEGLGWEMFRINYHRYFPSKKQRVKMAEQIRSVEQNEWIASSLIAETWSYKNLITMYIDFKKNRPAHIREELMIDFLNILEIIVKRILRKYRKTLI